MVAKVKLCTFFLNVIIDLHNLLSAGMSFHIFGPFTLSNTFRLFSRSTKLDFKIAIFHTGIVIVTGIAFFEV